MTDKEKALKKLSLEIDNDIEKLCVAAKDCSILELLYFIYQLHWTRLLQHFPNAKNINPNVLSAYSNTLEESLKYLTSLAAKYGNWNIVTTKEEIPYLNLDLVQFLIKQATLVNSKYESEALVKLFDIEVSGERNRYIRIDMSKAKTDENVKKLFDYYIRIDEDNNIKKNSKKDKDNLLKNFKDEYFPFSDLFHKEIGVSLDDFINFINESLNIVTNKITENQKKFDILENGNVEVKSLNTFINYAKCYLINKSDFLQSFDIEFEKVLKRLTLDLDNFNPKELKYHQLTRQPFIAKNNILVISPELILDSLFTNIHYSLIESPSIKNEYIARQASSFLDKIAMIATKFDYTEVDRELDLFEGKDQIGDIDILFKHSSGKYLLVEAKNHALPMDIYFKDVSKTNKHLQYLQDAWEKKVIRRANHLKTLHNIYNISENHKYIVVSRFPEIISHYSDLLILSIQEFEEWLSNYGNIDTFEDFNKIYNEKIGAKFSIDELKEMQDTNLFLGKFEKEQK
ncbi:hypothetical protein LPB248_04390 [Flavobacterium sp. LPB0248]|uniref:hypothetical protein n=1 Tax=Flavobacterium sp. LPB0248 TaxID=2614441 RepID=UPI0015A519FA|nr:hypothetical protein [Flavobacterium sp. LPB0248]QLC65557.1 hypothetical protein LPB248_04390 [Flavobacterium sp. LPB0248]